MKITEQQKQTAWEAYLEVINFCELEGKTLDASRIPKKTKENLQKELFDFIEKYLDMKISFSGQYNEIRSATHDFLFSRNNHGTGFWDRDWYSGKEKELDELAKSYKNIWFYFGRGGWLYSYVG